MNSPAPDTTPTSNLRQQIMYELDNMDSANKTETLDAIEALFVGAIEDLLPEKQQTSVYDSEARRLQAKGHNAAIDTIRRNFKGDSNG